MRSRFLSLGAAASLACFGVARADPAPSLPPPESHGRLVPGSTVELEPAELPRPLGPNLRVVPAEGALYLEQPAWTYTVERQRRCEAEKAAAVEVAGNQRWKALGVGATAGYAAGASVWAATSDAKPGMRWTAAGTALLSAVLSAVLASR